MPTAITQGDSFAFFLGDGASTTFPLGFSYLDTAHITVLVDGVAEVNPDDFSVVNSDVVFDIAPDNEADVRLIRVTDRGYSTRLVDFRSFGSITEDEMDLNQKQIWFLIQEAMETDDSGNVNPTAEYISWDDVRSRWTASRTATDQRLGDLANPAEGNEAATKDYVDGIAEWGIAGVPQGWQLTTTAGVTSYTLTNGYLLDPHYLIVAIDGVVQTPLVDFTVSQGSPSSTLQLLGLPPAAAGQTINVMNFGKTRFINVTVVGENAVGTDQLQDDAVTGPKIADDAVDSEHLAADSIDAEHYAPGSVDTTALADESVTFDKLKEIGFVAAPGGGVDQFLATDEATGTVSLRTITADDISDWLAALATVKQNTFAVPDGPIDMSGQKITNLAGPTTGSDAATKTYVDAAGSTGPKVDLIIEYDNLATASTWVIFNGAPAWFNDADYLYYEFVFSNWRWTGGGKCIFRFLDGAVWDEDWWWNGPYAPAADSPITWSVFITNPRTGSTKPTVSFSHQRAENGFGTPTTFGAKDGVQLRLETTTLPVDAKCQIYGHRAFA